MKKKKKCINSEMALAIRVCISCIENEVLPSKRSPFYWKLKEIYMAYKCGKVKK